MTYPVINHITCY